MSFKLTKMNFAGTIRAFQVSARNFFKFTGLAGKSNRLACLSYQEFRLILETMDDGFILQNSKGLVRQYNSAALSILGLSESQLLGRSSKDPEWNAIYEDGTPFPSSEHPRTVALRTGEKVCGIVMGLSRPSGAKTWVRINASPFRTADGELFVLSTFSDISDVVAARTDRERIFEVSRDLICVAGMDAYFKRVNPSFSRVLGYTNQELLSKPFLHFVHPDDLNTTLKEVEKLSQGQNTVHFENRYSTKSGAYRNLSWVTEPDPNTGLLYAIARDVTEIRAAEVGYRQVTAAINKTAIVLYFDSEGKILEVNENFCRISGFESEEMVGKTFVKDNIWEKISRGQTWLGEIESSAKSGNSFWLRSLITPLLDQENQIIKFLSINFDITDQKRAELESGNLRLELEQMLVQSQKSEKSFRTIFENSPVGIIQVDTKMRIVAANTAYTRLLGYSEDELKHLTIVDITHPEDKAETAKAINSTSFSKTNIRHFKKRYITKSGQVVWGRVSSRAVHFEDTGEVFLFSAIEDFTEIHNQEIQLQSAYQKIVDSEKFLKAVLQNMPSTVFVKDYRNDFRYSMINRAGAEMLGLAEDQINGKTDLDFFSREHAVNIMRTDREAFLKKSVLKIDQEEISTPRGPRLLRTYKVPTFDHLGEPQFLIGISNDITDEVFALKALEIERGKSLKNAKLASLGELSAGIAHEINNPLAIITGAVGLIAKVADQPLKLQSKIDMIEKSCARIARIVSGLKKFSGTGEKTQRLRINLEDIAKEVLILTEAKARRNSNVVTIETTEPGPIDCNEIEIEQVLINLINNSLDATRDLQDKWVKIFIFSNGECQTLQVIDSGPGISEDLRGRLFDPFFTTKKVGEGTGLGLSISKGILDEHQATISLKLDKPNTCFEIRFPTPMDVSDAD